MKIEENGYKVKYLGKAPSHPRDRFKRYDKVNEMKRKIKKISKISRIWL